jgi:hypothetical protein
LASQFGKQERTSGRQRQDQENVVGAASHHPVALEQRKRLTEAADVLLRWVAGTPGAKASLSPEDADKAFEEFSESLHVLQGQLADVAEKQREARRAEPATEATPGDTASIALLRLFTNGLANDQFAKAIDLLSNEKLNSNEKLTKIDALIPFPPTASAEQLGNLLRVSKQAVLKTDWWKRHRKGEKDNEIGRRWTKHRRRAKDYESSGSEDDDDER